MRKQEGPTFLRNLRINKVALVERGANEEAEIVFFKGAGIAPSSKSSSTDGRCSGCGAWIKADDLVASACPECGFVSAAKTIEKEDGVTIVKKSDVYSKIVEVSGRVREATPDLSVEQAIMKVYEQRPDLVEEYRQAVPDTDAGFELAEPEILGGEEAAKLAAQVHKRASELATEHGVPISKGYSLVFGDQVGQQLVSEYKSVLGDEEGAALYKNASGI